LDAGIAARNASYSPYASDRAGINHGTGGRRMVQDVWKRIKQGIREIIAGIITKSETAKLRKRAKKRRGSVLKNARD